VPELLLLSGQFAGERISAKADDHYKYNIKRFYLFTSRTVVLYKVNFVVNRCWFRQSCSGVWCF